MGTRCALLAGIAGLAFSMFGPAAIAQTTPPTPTAPTTPEPTIIPERGDEPVLPIQPTPVQRSVPSVRPPDAGDLPDGALPEGSQLAEGSFLSTRAGKLIKARTGDLIFIPEKTAQTRDLPAMVLLPSQKLGQIETSMGAPGFSGMVTLGGQVFVYRGHEYLLPTSFAQLTPPAPQTPEPATPPAKPEQPAKPKPAEELDPRAEDLIKDLESQRSAPRALEPQPASSAKESTGAPAEPDPKALMPEGTVVTFKRGRLVRLPELGGRIAFAFDNDPNSPAAPPMVIQPCGQLERLEALTARQGDSLAVKVSGRVLTFHGRNYLLPTLVQATRSGEVVPMQ